MGAYDRFKSPPRRYEFEQPTSRDVRPVNPVLSSLSIGFKNETFVHDKIAPVAEVDGRTGTYCVWTRDYFFRRLGGAVRAAEGPYTRTGYGLTWPTYSTIEIGYEKALGDVTNASSQTPEDLQTMDTQFLTNLIEIEIEKRVADATFVTGVWGTSNTLTGTNQWSDFGLSDPIGNAQLAIRTILRNTGAKPNTLIMGLLAWEKLAEHPLILDKYKHTQKGIMTPDLVAAVLGIDEIVVGESVENTADENQTFVGADIWTDNAVFLVRNSPALGVANGAYTFTWNEKGNVPWGVEDYREEQTRSDITRVFTHIQPAVVSAQHGYMFLDTVA